MKVLNFGSLNIDYVYHVDQFVLPGETRSALSQEINAGGKGLNQSIALARAGAEVYHAGCIGKEGQFLKELLEETGVNTTFLKEVRAPQGNAVIEVDAHGENRILLIHGSNDAIQKEDIPEVFSHFEKGDYLVLQNEINCLKEIVEEGNRKGMLIFLNPSPYNETIDTIDLTKINWLLVNEVEMAQITNESSPKEAYEILHQKYPQLSLVVTLGHQGSIAFDQDKVYEEGIYKVEAVDTTGAGDTYTGYFIASLTKGKAIQEAMHDASIASAISVTRKGAAPSIPTYEEVKEKDVS